MWWPLRRRFMRASLHIVKALGCLPRPPRPNPAHNEFLPDPLCLLKHKSIHSPLSRLEAKKKETTYFIKSNQKYCRKTKTMPDNRAGGGGGGRIALTGTGNRTSAARRKAARYLEHLDVSERAPRRSSQRTRHKEQNKEHVIITRASGTLKRETLTCCCYGHSSS